MSQIYDDMAAGPSGLALVDGRGRVQDCLAGLNDSERSVMLLLLRLQQAISERHTNAFCVIPQPEGVWSSEQRCRITPDLVIVGANGGVAIEIDGSQHGRTRAGDALRDRLIARSGLVVVRIHWRDALDVHHLACLLERPILEISGHELRALPLWDELQASA